MKQNTTRSIPPPIDLSVSGSNLLGPNSPGRSAKDCPKGGQYPYAFSCKYIIELDEGSPVPTSASPFIAPSSSPKPRPTQTLTPGSPACNPPNSSTSTCSFLSIPDWDNTRLMPNRRRRSYSESASTPDSPFSTQRSVSGPAGDGASTPPKSTEFPHSASPVSLPRTIRPSPSLTFSFRNKSKAMSPAESELCGQVPKQAPSTVGRRNKVWSSITHLPLSAGLSLEFGHSGDKNGARAPSKKIERPGTSPSTPSSWVSFTDAPANGSSLNRVKSLKKSNRPSTASSTASSSSSSPQRRSKLDWHWQWKRFSLLRTSRSSLSLTPVQTSTIPPVQSSPSPLSTSSATSSVSFPPCSPKFPPTSREAPNLSPHTRSPTKSGFSEHPNLTVIPNPKLRRSTPNLKAPDLSMEDLGKINAFYAPPPSALAVKALKETPRRRRASASSDPKFKPTLPLPPEVSRPALKSASKPLLVPLQNNVNTQHSPEGKGISIALPLSHAPGAGGKYDYEEEEVDVIYLTVEDVLDEESGEMILRLVEVPV